MKDKKEDKRNKRKKKKVWKKILCVILIILLIAIGWFAYRTYKNGGGLSGMLATAVGHDENTKKNLKEIRVLLLGVSTDIDSELTDTIMIASYNPNTQKANLLSIPRDTFTGKNPSKAQAYQKINAIYNMTRNPEKTLQAVNELTGLNLQYYVLIRTEALIKLVDAIGGVEFNVPIKMHYKDKTQDLLIDLDEGVQVLNGDKAEQLLRFRHNDDGSSYPIEYGDNDLGRMRTQRDFIIATLNQTLKPSNIFKIGQILEIAKENVETNLDFSYVKDYIPYAVEFSTDNMKTATLPGKTPDMAATNNISIFVANKTETKNIVEEMFPDENEESNQTSSVSNTITEGNTISNSTTAESQNIKIELINGSNDDNKLEKARQLLEEEGYDVTKKGKTSTISKTIITNKKETSDETLKQIKNVLGVGSISTSKSSTSKTDITIIIGTDFE